MTRSRRNNIQIRGFPDSISDLHTEIPALHSTLVPDLPSSQMLLDRVHRALGPKPQGGPPKDIVAKLHYFRAKEAIMSSPGLEYKGHKYSLYADLASLTIQCRKQLKHITAALLFHRIKYRWVYPFKQLFSHRISLLPSLRYRKAWH